MVRTETLVASTRRSATWSVRCSGARVRDHGRLGRRRGERTGPPALERLPEIHVPTLVLVGALDLDAIIDTARRVTEAIPNARRVDWPDTAHLPSMERPKDFLELLDNWLAL